VGLKNYALDGGPDPDTGRALLSLDMSGYCKYLIMNALCIVRLPPQANVLVQRTRQTKAFTAAMVTRRPAMRLFAKLL